MSDRDMYYGGYGGFIPINQMPNTSNQVPVNNSYFNGQFNDMTERISRLERQVKRLEQRLTRLEVPYANKDFGNDTDNNMYIM